jgi:1,2-diacylglycerol 3-beta-galactosyltransferase
MLREVQRRLGRGLKVAWGYWLGERTYWEAEKEETNGMPRSRSILFLVGDTGAGHRRAADAVRRAIEQLVAAGRALTTGQVTLARGAVAAPARLEEYPALGDYELDCIDAFRVAGRFPLRSLGPLYRFSIRYTPWMYGRLFHLTSHAPTFRLVEGVVYRLMSPGLAALIRRASPDLIVCLHPLLNHVVIQVLSDLDLRLPVLTVMTDLVTPHMSWIAPEIDGCIVPTEDARSICRQHGMPDSKIEVLGMPIDLEFGRTKDRGALCRKLGFNPDMPIILLTGGGEGVGPLLQLTSAVWRSDLPLQVILVTGRHRRLRQQLERERQQLPPWQQAACRILGFVPNMHELMGVADLVVTKAGPGTISEAIASRLPILLYGYVPGQEEGNVGYVCDQGIGRLADTPDRVISLLEECFFQPGSQLLQQMRSNMERLQNPSAALSIARAILGALPPDDDEEDALAGAPTIRDFSSRSSSRMNSLSRVREDR